MRRDLPYNGYVEIPIIGEHTVAVLALPWINRDPFDRILIAQSVLERIVLLTADPMMARYRGLVRQV